MAKLICGLTRFVLVSVACDFPDAYVDPYPEVWAGIVRLAQLGQQIAAALPANTSASANIGPYFAAVQSVASTVAAMAEENGPDSR